MADNKDDHPIRILHLSDFHFKKDRAWDADPVLRALAGVIEQQVGKGFVPDLVAITGDIAFAGVAKEYALARKWLDNLWPKLGGLERDRLLIVPGNHDVDRAKVDIMVKATQKHLLGVGDQTEIASVLNDKNQRRALVKRHDAYLKFAKEWFDARLRRCRGGSG